MYTNPVIMKGIVIKYVEKGAYGFIKDQNGDTRFFHISSFRDKRKFLDDIYDYCADPEEGTCYVITFTPATNGEKLIASNINLTTQILNDRSKKIAFEAKVTDVFYDVRSLTRMVQGIKQGEHPPFNTTAGGNGTYRIGYPEVYRNLYMEFRRNDDIGWGTIDVRDEALKLNRRAKITDSFVRTLKANLINANIAIASNGTNWIMKNPSILII
jgi:hypothetical protein